MPGLFTATAVLLLIAGVLARLARASPGVFSLFGVLTALGVASFGLVGSGTAAPTDAVPAFTIFFCCTVPLFVALCSFASARRRHPARGAQELWPWLLPALLLALLATASRIRLFDAQLLALVGLATLWWQSRLDHATHRMTAGSARQIPRPQRSIPIRQPSLSAAAIISAAAAAIAATRLDWRALPLTASVAAGAALLLVSMPPRAPRADIDAPHGHSSRHPAFTLFLSLSLGLGLAAIAFITRRIRLNLAASAVDLSPLESLLIVADSLRTAPYMPGLRTLTEEAWIVCGLAVALLWIDRLPERCARAASRVLGLLAALAAAWALLHGLRILRGFS